MCLIYRFFKHLVDNKGCLQKVERLSEFPFNKEMLCNQNKGIFPDLILFQKIKGVGVDELVLVELKDSKESAIASFNSTIPTGQKSIKEITKGKEDSKIIKDLKAKKIDYCDVKKLDVYYLIRGGGVNPI